MTGLSENGPRSETCAITRRSSVSASAAVAAPAASSTRRRSAPSTCRTASTSRRRGIVRTASCRSTLTSSASTDGSTRSTACTAAALSLLPLGGKQRLHPLFHARDDLVSLASDRRSVHGAGGRAQQAPHGFLGQPSPEFVEVLRGESLPLQRPAPLTREVLNEAIALERQPAGAPDQLGKARRHCATPSPDSGRYLSDWPPSGRWRRTDRSARP